MSEPKFTMYKDRAGKWRWVWTARNGRKIAASGESFSSKRSCRRAVLQFTGMSMPVMIEERA